jgi:hypothetical protein
VDLPGAGTTTVPDEVPALAEQLAPGHAINFTGRIERTRP